MTELWLFRHAAAASPLPARVAEVGQDRADAERALTDRGARRFRRFVKFLSHQRLQFDLLLHSPRLRAVLSAELLHPLVAGRTEVCAELDEPPGPGLRARLGGERIALVGHQPWLGQLLDQLVGTVIPLATWPKGGLVCVESTDAVGPYRLRLIMGPRDFCSDPRSTTRPNP